MQKSTWLNLRRCDAVAAPKREAAVREADQQRLHAAGVHGAEGRGRLTGSNRGGPTGTRATGAVARKQKAPGLVKDTASGSVSKGISFSARINCK